MRKPWGFWGWLLAVVAVCYLAALVATVLAFHFVGERWWPTAAALYLPRWPLGLPLPILGAMLAVRGPRRLLVTVVAAAAVWLFPIMGLRVGRAPSPTQGAARLRVLSFNVDSGRAGTDNITALIRAANPDLIFLQEVHPGQHPQLAAGLPGYHVHHTHQFWTASRYPITEAFEPPLIPYGGAQRTARFMRYLIAAPEGTVQVYSIHPISPRDALEDLRGAGISHEVATGRLLKSPAAAKVAANAGLRMEQLRIIAEDAGRSPHPVIIAGDTNLPVLSWGLGHWLGRFEDGFAAVGSGFGYTFPAPKRPWMRIDRVLAGPGFRFLSFAVVDRRASDHLAVVADLERSPRPL